MLIDLSHKFHDEFWGIQEDLKEICEEIGNGAWYTSNYIKGARNRKRKTVREPVLFIRRKGPVEWLSAQWDLKGMARVPSRAPVVVVPGMNNFPGDFLPVSVFVRHESFGDLVRDKFSREFYRNVEFNYLESMGSEVVWPKYAGVFS
jgi:hypothetical protein